MHLLCGLLVLSPAAALMTSRIDVGSPFRRAEDKGPQARPSAQG